MTLDIIEYYVLSEEMREMRENQLFILHVVVDLI